MSRMSRSLLMKFLLMSLSILNTVLVAALFYFGLIDLNILA